MRVYARRGQRMKKEQKFSAKIFWAVNAVAFAFFVALMVVATKYDLQINHALSDGDSFFADLFSIIGEYPAYVAVPVGGVIIFFNAPLFEKKYQHKNIFPLGRNFIGFFWRSRQKRQ